MSERSLNAQQYENLIGNDLAQQALDASETGVIVIDSEKSVLFWNSWAAKMSGISAKQAVGVTLSQVFGEPLSARVKSAIQGALERARTSLLSHKLNKHPFPFYLDLEDTDERTRIFQMVIIKPIEVESCGRHCLIQVYDVSKAVKREQALQAIALVARNSEEYVRAVLESTSDGIITFSQDGTIETANTSIARIFEISEGAILGDNLKSYVAATPDMADIFIGNFEDQIKNWEKTEGRIEFTGLRSSGKKFPVDFSISLMSLENKTRYVGIIRDITEWKNAEERLTQLAQYDALTGLANRSLFRDRLIQALARSDRNNGYVALLFLDLDRFKIINDTFGHDAGDDLLIQTAQRLVSCVRKTDTVARLGGDEFTIILEEAKDLAIAGKIAIKILEEMAKPFFLKKHEVYVTTSIGISSYPESGEDAELLIKAADTAMYAAKTDGRNNYKFFDPNMDSVSKVRLALEADLRHAIERGELRLFYQPQVNLKTGKVDGCEALIRWIHPHRGLIPPDDFIPLAEETGIIFDIGKWVIREASMICKKWADTGAHEMKVAINISPHQFRQHAIKQILIDAVQSVDLDPKLI